jgi:hypothetical protein
VGSVGAADDGEVGGGRAGHGVLRAGGADGAGDIRPITRP